MNQPAQRSGARIGRPDRGTAWRAGEPGRRRFTALGDAPAAGRQEALWAQLVAERPDVLGDVVTFVQGATRQFAEPPAPPRRTVADDA
jgi:hypothetical protein